MIFRLATRTVCLAAALALSITNVFGDNGTLTNLGSYAVYDGTIYANRINLASTVGSTWYTAYEQDQYSPSEVFSFVSAWTSSGWGTPSQLSPPNGMGADNPNLAWDSLMGRPVYAYHDWAATQTTSNIWFGYYNSSTSSWVLGNGGQPVLSASLGFWDYPSVDVDSTGRIIVSGFLRTSPYGYWTVVSTNHGQTFSTVNTSTNYGRVGTSNAFLSRTVAAGSEFLTFVPIPSSSNQNIPVGIQLYTSTNGISWTLTKNPLISFAAAMNNSPGTYSNGQYTGPIYYTSEIDAHGYTNGNWSVVAQMNNTIGGQPYNNIVMCTSLFGGACYVINSAQDDEFLASTDVSGDGGVWVSYVTYSTLQTRQLPLITQSIYRPPSGSTLGLTTYADLNPTYWQFDYPNDRCTVSCFDGGDYWRMAANPYTGASAPFLLQQTSPLDAVWQVFLEDPPSPLVPGSFTPTVLEVPFGSDLSSLGTAALPPGTAGLTAVRPPRSIPLPPSTVTPAAPAPPTSTTAGAPQP